MKRVLIATDGSQVAHDAAKFVAQLPVKEQLQVTVVSVLQETKAFHREAPQAWIRDALQAQTDAMKASYERIASCFAKGDAQLEHHICSGHAGKEIVSLGKELDVDLIVVGAKGHSTISRVLLGSTSDFVATHATSSVLVVRPSMRPSTERFSIDLAFDDSEPARHMIEEFCEIPWGDSVQTRIVTVLQSVEGPFGRVDPDEAESALAMQNASKARETVEVAAPNCDVKIVQHSHLADGLVQAIHEHESDLVFLGEHDRSAFDRLLMGSVSRFVLRHVQSSVWIARSVSPTKDVSQAQATDESVVAETA